MARWLDKIERALDKIERALGKLNRILLFMLCLSIPLWIMAQAYLLIDKCENNRMFLAIEHSTGTIIICGNRHVKPIEKGISK